MTDKNINPKSSRTRHKKDTNLIGFDNEKYVKLQSAKIDERIKMFGDKLYLEFGGKILDELNASRILPGFDPGAKIEALKKLKDKLEIIFCINAGDIEKKKIRADHGISYEIELLRLIDNLKKLGLSTTAVVITLYNPQINTVKLQSQLETRGIKVYHHTFTKGYPTDVDTIVSKEGYGAQPFIKTTKPLVVVAAPGANSGKLATCLTQLYHEHKRGVKAGYAKFETLPVWNLSLKHPINMAYEAATADIGDINMIDNFHLEAYGKTAINYNRDLAVFPILKNILHRITGEDIYRSPTDMGINTVGQCITDDEIVRRASCNEIIRRYLNSLCDYKNGIYSIEVPNRIKLLMDELGLDVRDRKVVEVALATSKKRKSNIVAVELPGGEIVTGKDTDLMTAPAAAVINTIKQLGKIPDEIRLISPIRLNSVLDIKKTVYGETRINVRDVLIILARSRDTNPTIKFVLSNLENLRGLEAHSTVILPEIELNSLKKLGLNITCTDEFAY